MTELMPSELLSSSQVTFLVKSHPNKSKNAFVDLTLFAVHLVHNILIRSSPTPSCYISDPCYYIFIHYQSGSLS